MRLIIPPQSGTYTSPSTTAGVAEMSPAAEYVHLTESLEAVCGPRIPARDVDRVLHTFCPNEGQPTWRAEQSGGRRGPGNRLRSSAATDVGSGAFVEEPQATGRPAIRTTAARHEAVATFTRPSSRGTRGFANGETIGLRRERPNPTPQTPSYGALFRKAIVICCRHSSQSARGLDEGPGDPSRIVGGEEGGDARDVVRVAEPAERGVLPHLLSPVALGDA